ncbi:MAG: alpha-ketoglutarate-dependent dioxygenase AlkB [Alphaproteobacteria bacterium]
MQFINGKVKREIYLEPRSLIVISGEARFRWAHAIPARKSDIVDDFKIERNRRISLTFRTVILLDNVQILEIITHKYPTS